MMSTPVFVLVAFSFLTAVVLADDAVVVIKASAAVDVPALKAVAGTSAVFKVRRLNFYANAVYKGKYNPPGEYTRTKWNYLVLGKGLTSSAAKAAFIAKIRAFDFVEVSSSISLTVNPHFNHADLNKKMATASSANFVPRPMAAAYPSGCDAVTIDGIGADGRALVISFSKYGDEKALKKYAGDLLMKVFPALGAKYVYSAVSTDGDFDAFTIMDYVNKATWCEYALSQYVRDNIPAFTKSFQAMAALTAVEV